MVLTCILGIIKTNNTPIPMAAKAQSLLMAKYFLSLEMSQATYPNVRGDGMITNSNGLM